MVELREKLELNKCTIVDKDWYPKNPEPTTVLVIQVPLTPSIADVLKCRNMAYNLNDVPNQFEGTFGLPYKLVDVELKLSEQNGSLLSFMPNLITKLRIGHDAKDNLMLTLRAHFYGHGYAEALNDWANATNTKEFEACLVSLQGNLFELAEKKGDGAAGGTRVNMSGDDDEEDADEERGLPDTRPEETDGQEPIGTFLQGDALETHNAQTGESSGPAIAPAALVGGTHQRGTKQQRGRRGGEPRDPEREAAADGTAIQ